MLPCHWTMALKELLSRHCVDWTSCPPAKRPGPRKAPWGAVSPPVRQSTEALVRQQDDLGLNAELVALPVGLQGEVALLGRLGGPACWPAAPAAGSIPRVLRGLETLHVMLTTPLVGVVITADTGIAPV